MMMYQANYSSIEAYGRQHFGRKKTELSWFCLVFNQHAIYIHKTVSIDDKICYLNISENIKDSKSQRTPFFKSTQAHTVGHYP